MASVPRPKLLVVLTPRADEPAPALLRGIPPAIVDSCDCELLLVQPASRSPAATTRRERVPLAGTMMPATRLENVH